MKLESDCIEWSCRFLSSLPQFTHTYEMRKEPEVRMRLINDDLCDSARVENRSDGSFRAQTKREQTLNLKIQRSRHHCNTKTLSEIVLVL